MSFGTLSKSESLRLKGVAILMMLFHHLYKTPDRIGDLVTFMPFKESDIVSLASSCKVLVGIFVFITGYGLFLSYKSAMDGARGDDVQNASGTWVAQHLVKLIMMFLFVYVIAFVVTMLIDGRPIDVYFSGSKLAGVLYVIIDGLGLADLFDTPTLMSVWWYMSAALAYVVAVPLIYHLKKKIGYVASICLVCALPMSLSVSFGAGMSPYGFLPILIAGMMFADLHLFERMDSIKRAHVRRINDGVFSVPYAVLFGVLAFCALRLYNRVDDDGMFVITYNVLPMFVILFLRYGIISTLAWCPLQFIGAHSMTMFLTHDFIRDMYLHDLVYSHYFLIDYAILFFLSLAVAVSIDWLRTRFRYDVAIRHVKDKISKLAICH